MHLTYEKKCGFLCTALKSKEDKRILVPGREALALAGLMLGGLGVFFRGLGRYCDVLT